MSTFPGAAAAPPVTSVNLQRALQFYRAGDLASAEDLCRGILRQTPSDSEALHLLGLIAFACGHPAIARDLIADAISFSPHNADYHINLGNALVDLHDRDAALASFDRAAELRPDLGEVYFYRANLLQDMKHFERALADYDRAIALSPGLLESYFNRGNALASLHRRAEALESYIKSAELLPGELAPRKNVFWLRIAQGADDSLVEGLAREMWEIESEAEVQRLLKERSISAFRAAHDFEQAAYLRERNFDLEGLDRAHRSLKAVNERIHAPLSDAGKITLSEEELADIIRFRKLHVRAPIPAPSGSPLNPDNDWAALEARYLGGETLVIDNFLSASALAELQQFCLVSTVWRQEYKFGYLGAFAHGGFVSPLHLRIARGLSAAMPRLFAGQDLEQLWAFKYDSRARRGINVHADFAKLNLNFWITPGAANLDPATGGMVIYDQPPPDNWNFREYNDDEQQARIYAFLAEAGARKCVVPHRCNRAVLFNSKLFHETDVIDFKTGYDNRRINVTYLFGRGDT